MKKLEQLYNSESYDKISKEDKNIEEMKIEEVLEFLNEKYEKISTTEERKKYFLFLEFLSKNENYIKDDSFAKIVLKMTLAETKTENLDHHRNSLLQTIKRIFSNFLKTNEDSIFKKTLGIMITKSDSKSFGILCKIIFLTKSSYFNSFVQKRYQTQLTKIEKSPFAMNPYSLLLLEQKFVSENIVSVLNKLLKKSINNYTIIVEAVSELDKIKFGENKNLIEFDNLLEIQLVDAFVKGEPYTSQSFYILGKIVKHRSHYENLPKINKIFDELTKKMSTNKNTEICQLYCDLIAATNLSAFGNSTKRIFKQFFDSLKNLNEKTSKRILSALLANKSFTHSTSALNELLNKEIKDSNIAFHFDLLLSLSHTKNEELKLFYKDKIEMEKKMLDLKANNIYNVNNFRNFVWGAGFFLKNEEENHIDENTLDLKLLTKNFLKKEHIWFNKNLMNFITPEEAFLLLHIICRISEELCNSVKNADKMIIGVLLVNLIRKMENSKFKKIELSRSLGEFLVDGIYVFNKILQDHENENLSNFVFKVLFSQQRFILQEDEHLNKLSLALSFTPLTNSINLKFYKKYLKSAIFEKFGNFGNFDFLNFVFDKNHLMAFDDMVYFKCIDYLTNMMFFFPNLIAKFSLFFDVDIICRLTRMKRLSEVIKYLKTTNKFFWKKNELESLEVFGYVTRSYINNFLKEKNEEIEEKEKVWTTLEFLKNSETTEDEKYEELENLNIKEIIIEDYRDLLIKINLIFFHFQKKYQKLLQKEHLHYLDVSNKTLFKSVKEAKNLSDVVEATFQNIFDCFLVSENENLKELSGIYCYIINDVSDDHVKTKIEEFIQKLKENEKISEKLFLVFFDILNYVVKYKFDVELKKKIVNYLIDSIETNPQFKKMFFKFVCQNINDLYFKEIFNFIETTMLDLSKTDEDVIDLSLENLLNYEEFAIKIYLEKIKKVFMQENFVEQKVLAYQRLKLLTMTESPNEEITEMAKELIEKNKCVIFDVDSLKNLNFDDLIIDLPFDLNNIVRSVMKNLYLSLQEEEKRNFLEKLISEFVLLLDKKFVEMEKDKISERLEIFPNILLDIADSIDDHFVSKIFECLILIERKGYTKLNKLSIEFGVHLINIKKHLIEDMTLIFQNYIKSGEGLICPIIFIGESAKVDINLFEKFKNLENNLLNLLEHKDISFHKNLSKYIRNLIGFFKNPSKILEELIKKTIMLEDANTIRINCYFIAGMIKGIGVKSIEECKIFENIQSFIAGSKKRDLKDIFIGKRYYSVYLIHSLWFCLKKVVEPLIADIIGILMNFLGDNLEDIRDFTKKSLDKIMKEVSSYSIKQIIPILLEGTEDKNWRKKLNSILALGAVAYCGIKQLSENLPIIVPRLTNKINDTNENIKEAAVNSLSKILSTIKNPEISQIRDTIILSLSNPFANNQKSLEALLSIKFMHYIDGPALSLIMPIIIYGLKSCPKSESKEKAAKVVANILTLINNDEDIWPHIENLIDALQHTLKDLNPDVRAVSSKAFKSIAVKFNSLSNFMLNRLKATLVDKETISIEKAGNAQAFAEILSIMDEQSFLYIFESLLNLTMDKREHVRESFLSVFVYLPIIQGQKYQKYVIKTCDFILKNIDHEKERIRNLSIKCMKIIIQNFFNENQDYLIKELYEGSIDENYIKRNSSLILVGDMIEKIFKSNNIPVDDVYRNYGKIFATIYIMKNDLNGEVKITALNIFKTFIDNTPKCLKCIYLDLVNCFIDIYLRQTEHYNEIADNGLKEFSLKYGDVFVNDILDKINVLKQNCELAFLLGIVIFLKQFIKFYNRSYFTDDRIAKLAKVLLEFFESENDDIWKQAVRGLRNLSELTSVTNFLKDVIENLIKDVNNYQLKNENEENEENEENGENGDEDDVKEENGDEDDVNQEEVEMEDDEDEEEDDEDEYLPREKLIELICELFMSENSKITNYANKYVFENGFKEWQVTVLIINIRIYGSFLYEMKELKKGIKLFLDFYEVN